MTPALALSSDESDPRSRLDFNHPKDHFQVLYLHTQAGKDLPGSLASEL